MSRRARVEPEDVGVARGADRRVPGLRRGEAAALAGVSVEYYARLERGAIAGASDAVLDGLAKALQMDDAEREYLHRLAQQAGGIKTAKRGGDKAGAGLAAIAEHPMVPRLDGIRRRADRQRPDRSAGLEPPGRRTDGRGDHTPPPRLRRTSPGSSSWNRSPAGSTPNGMRSQGSTSRSCAPRPDATRTASSCTTWSASSRPAAITSGSLWGRHDVWEHQSGVKRFHHHAVGDITLHFNGLDLVGQPAVQLTVLAAEPGSPDHQALSCWATGHRRNGIQRTLQPR